VKMLKEFDSRELEKWSQYLDNSSPPGIIGRWSINYGYGLGEIPPKW